MKKYLLLSFMLMFAFVYSDTWAQQRTISGNVTSVEDGSALPGVNVVLKGSTAGTVTDIDGNYSLSVPTEGGTLVFSFIGLASEEVEIGSRSVVDIQMTADVKQLSEVVVVGFGTQSKRNLTSSIVSVGSEDIQNVSVQGFEQAIQGRMAGVNITGASGTLGASQAIRVRGVSSINASNQPLFVVDGIPMTNDDTNLGGAALGGPGTNPLINLNPNDIESIEVLKDAASAAIYGSRGTNGVILITTKRGKAGKTNIGVNYYAGFSDPTTDFDLLSGPEYQRLKNYGNFQRFGNDYFDPVEDDSFQNTQDAPNADHIDAITRTAFVHEASLSATGGNEKTKFYAGATYRDEEGYVLTTRLKRYSGRINIDHA
ncbi:MAG: SusC/RagA family TonB-linked outer membrane protein, partial [Cytophagales bacterium]|nr:SusC/RagA family TonB-linked outer membrane protein [Cytophagales bacterium]